VLFIRFCLYFCLIWTALSLVAELGGYLGLFLGFSLLQISGLLSYLRIQFRQIFITIVYNKVSKKFAFLHCTVLLVVLYDYHSLYFLKNDNFYSEYCTVHNPSLPGRWLGKQKLNFLWSSPLMLCLWKKF